MPKLKRAILTGFEPFGPYKYNPVQDLARHYNKKRVDGVEIVGIVLPCTYKGAFDMLSEEIDRLSPEIILSAGLASRIKRIRLESKGQNVMDGKYADAEGYMPKKEFIVAKDRWWYATNADNSALVFSLSKHGIPAELSVNADAYICNSLIYLTARRIANEHLPIEHAFFHTPWTDNYLDRIKLRIGQVTIKKEDLEKSVEILLKGMKR